jgi:hypothetical protein
MMNHKRKNTVLIDLSMLVNLEGQKKGFRINSLWVFAVNEGGLQFENTFHLLAWQRGG